jgi:hypothetical protein
MVRFAQKAIQHDFGFLRILRAATVEREALYATLVSLGATEMMAERLMQDFPSAPDGMPGDRRLHQ